MYTSLHWTLSTGNLTSSDGGSTELRHNNKCSMCRDKQWYVLTHSMRHITTAYLSSATNQKLPKQFFESMFLKVINKTNRLNIGHQVC